MAGVLPLVPWKKDDHPGGNKAAENRSGYFCRGCPDEAACGWGRGVGGLGGGWWVWREGGRVF